MQQVGEAASAPLAAIDMGSNTVHLAVARPTTAGGLAILADETVLVRLGADLAATGQIGTERAAHATATVRAQAERARALGATVLLGIATEGVRAARNGEAFLARLYDETGVAFTLITGEQEAALTYWGVTSEQVESATSTTATTPTRRGVVDLGGGSLELVVGEGSRVGWRISLPLGSGAIHDHYTPGDPLSAAELAQARSVAEEMLRPLDLPLPVAMASACGGSATALQRLATRVNGGDDLIGKNAANDALTTADLQRLLALLQQMPAREITARYGIEEGRARLLGAGAVVLLAVIERLGVERLHVSQRGIREGAILAYLHAGDGWLTAATQGTGWH